MFRSVFLLLSFSALPLSVLVCHHFWGPLRLRALSAALQHLEPIQLCWVSVVPGGLEVVGWGCAGLG